MSFIRFLNHWWNLPFLVLLGLVIVFYGLQAAGWAHHHKDIDHDHDHEDAHDLAAFLAPIFAEPRSTVRCNARAG